MFDIGWSELLIVGLVALIVVGPKELPALMRTIGAFIRQIKETASSFQSQIKTAMDEGEFGKLRTEMEDIGQDIGQDIGKSLGGGEMMRDLNSEFYEYDEFDEFDDWNQRVLKEQADAEQSKSDIANPSLDDEPLLDAEGERLEQAALDETVDDETTEAGDGAPAVDGRSKHHS